MAEAGQRRSIFGGLLLILIGLLFLAWERMPTWDLWHVFSRYWPLLLILWGLTKLFDNLAAHRAGETRPPLITGGEVALIVLLLVAVGVISGARLVRRDHPDLDLGDGWFTQKYSTEESLPPQVVKAGSSISVHSDRGAITVYADETDHLRVLANKSATAGNEDEARERAADLTVAVRSVAGGYEIEPGGGENASSAHVDLEIHVPKQVKVTAQTGTGNISMSDVGGTVSATTSSGDVDIRDCGADVTASIQSGDARISGVAGNVHVTGRGSAVEITDVNGDTTVDGEFYGPVRLQNVKGAAKYSSARTQLTILHLSGRMEMDSGDIEISDAAGDTQLATRNRDLDIENVAGRLSVSDTHGDIQVRYDQPPKQDITIADDSGAVDLTLPEKSAFEISAVSRSGEVDSDFQDPGLQLVNESDTHTLNGRFGAHGPKITITTTYGTISLHKGS
jgi:DUF4097 and DUF4098 domain-containing protein YvlB